MLREIQNTLGAKPEMKGSREKPGYKVLERHLSQHILSSTGDKRGLFLAQYGHILGVGREPLANSALSGLLRRSRKYWGGRTAFRV